MLLLIKYSEKVRARHGLILMLFILSFWGCDVATQRSESKTQLKMIVLIEGPVDSVCYTNSERLIDSLKIVFGMGFYHDSINIISSGKSFIKKNVTTDLSSGYADFVGIPIYYNIDTFSFKVSLSEKGIGIVKIPKCYKKIYFNYINDTLVGTATNYVHEFE